MLFDEDAKIVIGDPTEIERAHANQTNYAGTLMDGQTKGYWKLTLATPLRAEPFHSTSSPILRARLKINHRPAIWSTSKPSKRSSN